MYLFDINGLSDNMYKFSTIKHLFKNNFYFPTIESDEL